MTQLVKNRSFSLLLFFIPFFTLAMEKNKLNKLGSAKVDQELIDAAIEVDIAGMRAALKKGANPNATDARERTALLILAQKTAITPDGMVPDYSPQSRMVIKLINFGADSTKRRSILFYSPLEIIANRLLIEYEPLVQLAQAFLWSTKNDTFENPPYPIIASIAQAAQLRIQTFEKRNEKEKARPFYTLISDTFKAGFNPSQSLLEFFQPNIHVLFKEFKAQQENKMQEALNFLLPVKELYSIILEY